MTAESRSASSCFTEPFLSEFQIPSDSRNEEFSLPPVYENTSRESLSVFTLQSNDDTLLLDLDKPVKEIDEIIYVVSIDGYY